MDELVQALNLHNRAVASFVEIGELASQVRNKRVNLESSRRARTLVETGEITRTFMRPPAVPAKPRAEVAVKPYLLYADATQTQSPSTTLVLSTSYSLAGSPQTTIGSALDNNIVLDKEDVSRYHAQIENSKDGFLLVDLNSSNGSYVNGERVLRPSSIEGRRSFSDRDGVVYFCGVSCRVGGVSLVMLLTRFGDRNSRVRG